MDFSKVRLADFSQARLRDVLAGDEQQSEDQSGLDGSIDASATFDSLSMSNIDGLGALPDGAVLGRVLAHAPQYSVTSLSTVDFGNDDILEMDLDPNTGYCLVVTREGLTLWKQQADNRIFFALPPDHAVSARFIKVKPRESHSTQPHFVLVDRKFGRITYFDSVSRAVINPDVDFGKSQQRGQRQNHGYVGSVELGDTEEIEHLEIVGELGLVVASNWGHFYWINLRNDLGKIAVCATPMRHGSGILSRLRSLGAFSRDVVSIRTGRPVKSTQSGGLGYQVYVVNRYGDIALWNVGLDGVHELVTETRAGPKLTAQMDLLYPNSGVTLCVHDLAVESDYTHVLASFAPDSDSASRVFVVISFNLDFDVVSVRRLQTYESRTGFMDQTTINLHVNSAGVIVVVTSDAFVLIDSPSKFDGEPYSAGLPPPRWEECLYLKEHVAVFTSTPGRENSILIGTSWDLVDLRVTGTVNTEEGVTESTSKVRLEQAVFEASSTNPLDLHRWSTFEAKPDPNAASQFALEIANAETPFVPVELPNLTVHIEIRQAKLLELYSLAPEVPVREVAQALIAAAVLNKWYERSSSSGQLSKLLMATLKKLNVKQSIRDVFLHNVLVVPMLLADMASVTNSSGANSNLGKNSGASLLTDMAYLILEVLQLCDLNDLSIPMWATAAPYEQALESLASIASDSDNAELLATVTDILCSIYETTAVQNSPVTRNMLFKLARLSSAAAINIAAKHNLYSAWAPLEVDQWLQTNDPSTVLEHINELPDEYSEHIFETCVTSHHIRELVQQLASVYSEKVMDYLTKHNLHTIAWTLAPQSQASTQQLQLATKCAENAHDQRLYASLYKISAYFTGAGSVDEAQSELELVAAKDSLSKQYQLSGINKAESSSLVRHGLALLSKPSFDCDTAVDLFALAPLQAIPEMNENFVRGFKLVARNDSVRQRLLVQQIIINTNWDRISNSLANDGSGSDPQTVIRRLKQTLFYHTLEKLSPAYASLLLNFRATLIAYDPQEVKAAYSWDSDDTVFTELSEIALRAQSIADKYDVYSLVAPLVDDSMDIE